MCGIFGLLSLAMNSRVFVDLLTELSEHALALRDVLEEGRLDMVHQCSIE